MAKIPKSIREVSGITGLPRVNQGKVRDTHRIVYGDKWGLLMVATDRLSIFDFVLPALVPMKGEVLTALTHFWLNGILDGFPHHLLPSLTRRHDRNYAHDMARIYPEISATRSLAVKRLDVMPFELIFRHHIGGSVYKKYAETGMAAGQLLPSGLPKWSELEYPICTPSTKSEEGHDVNITLEKFLKTAGEQGKRAVEMLTAAYKAAYVYAGEMGILILDTKFEVGVDEDGSVVIVDEVLTPDSSRFTSAKDWEKAMNEGRDPIFLDKEPVRAWGKTVKTPFFSGEDKLLTGIHRLEPDNPEHVAFVHSLEVPKEIIIETSRRYRSIFRTLTGYALEEYQKKYML